MAKLTIIKSGEFENTPSLIKKKLGGIIEREEVFSDFTEIFNRLYEVGLPSTVTITPEIKVKHGNGLPMEIREWPIQGPHSPQEFIWEIAKIVVV